MSNPETDAATPRFARGSGVTSKDYSRSMALPGNVADLRASYAAYRMRMLGLLLCFILASSAMLWILDGIATVGTLHYAGGVGVALAVILHLGISLIQGHLLSVKGLAVKLFGEGAKIATWVGLLIWGVTAAVAFVNIGSTSLGGLYLLDMAGYNYMGARPAAVATIAALVVSNAEQIFVFSWLALSWLRRHS